MKLWFDIETRSKCDLSKEGAARYSLHESTELICIAWAIDDAPVQVHFTEDDDIPAELKEHFYNKDIELWAHNAAFERAVYDNCLTKKYGLPVVELRRWRCSSALALANALPASLEALASALNLPIKKLTEGKRLIRDYSCYPYLAEWKHGDKELMAEYNRLDVESMRMACSVLRSMEQWEWEQYHITEEINDRGIPCDISFAEAALEYADEIRGDVNDNIIAITGGLIKKSTERKNRDVWLKDNLPPAALKVISVTSKNKKTGEEISKISFDEKKRAKLIEHSETPEVVKEFADLVNQAGGATISKYAAAINLNVAGRVKGTLLFNGASATGRYSARGLQPHNFNRNVIDDPEEAEALIQDVLNGYEIARPATTLGRLARNMITSPEGITYCDYSQVEARICPWLSLDPAADELLLLFKRNLPYYEYNAVKMYELPSLDYLFELKESDPKRYDHYRQNAKVACLSCQFGGGADLGDVRDAWRRANPWAPRLWEALSSAANAAMQSPNEVFWAGRVCFMFNGQDYLWMRLPCGRLITYPKPEFRQIMPPWAEDENDMIWSLTCLSGSARAVDPKTLEWPRRVLNHLVFANNATQGTAASLMRSSIVRAANAGLPVIGTVHDELLVEGDHSSKVENAMLNVGEVYDGLPLAAKAKFQQRWGK